MGAVDAYDQAFLRLDKPPRWNPAEKTVRAVDLFSGCGGLSLGVREACRALNLGFEAALAIDNHGPSLAVYRDNFRPDLAYDHDIRDLVDGEWGAPPTAAERLLLDAMGDQPPHLQLSGPPCQGHSDLNNHTRRRDRRNALYDRVVRFAELTRPAHILIENVPTVVHAQEAVVARAAERLASLGYRVSQHRIDLSLLGVPQTRRRHVLLGSKGTDTPLASLQCANRRDLRWAIGDLEQAGEEAFLDRPSRHTPENRDRFAYLLERGLYDLPDHQRPVCHRDGGHSYRSMYGRLRWDQPAQTITSGFVSPGQGRFIHPSRPRTLTPHEAARLQFFPDFFDFSAVRTRTALAAMIGNAVPLKLSYAFALPLLSVLRHSGSQDRAA